MRSNIRPQEGKFPWTAHALKILGKGKSQKEIEKFFSDQHYSTWGTKREKGFGLGLEISRQFAARNNGKLFCVSEPDKGSTFTLELPVSKGSNKDLQSF